MPLEASLSLVGSIHTGPSPPPRVPPSATNGCSAAPMYMPNVMEMEASRVSDETASLPQRSASSSVHSSSFPSSVAVPRLLSQPHRDGAHRGATLATVPRAPHRDTSFRSEPSCRATTPRLNSGLSSLQSSITALSPAASGTHSPRSRAAGGLTGATFCRLPPFQSVTAMPATGEAVAVVPTATGNGATGEEEEGRPRPSETSAPPVSATAVGPVELPMLDERKHDYGGTSEKRRAGDHRSDEGCESGNAQQGSGIEFNSFAAIDSSFVRDASFHGGPGAADGGCRSLAKAVFHLFKGNVGAGVFLLPTYYQDSGYFLGALCVLLLGLLMIDCAVALLRAKNAINRADVKTYPAVVDYILGRWCCYFTDFALVFTQFGFCVMYIQYASSIFASLFPFPHSYAVCIAITVLVVTPMTFISNRMNLLAVPTLGYGGFGGVVLAGAPVVDVQHLSASGVGPGVAAFLPTARILVFLSGHMFSLEGIGVVLPVEGSLAAEQRRRFGRVVKCTLASVVVLYIAFGVLGYCAYGENLHTSVVLALPDGAVKEALQCLLGLSLIFGFPIQYVPAIQLVDRAVRVSLFHDRAKAYLVRALLNGLLGAFALFIGGDALNLFAGFLGAFAGVHLMITIPSLLALQTENALEANRDSLSRTQRMAKMFCGPWTWHRVRYLVYLVFALVVWIGGLYFTFDAVFNEPPRAAATDDPTPQPFYSSPAE